MPKLGKESYIVRLLAKKTKVKPEDIFDLLMALPECLSEAFFEAEPDEKVRVNFGAFLIYWKDTNLGPGIFVEPSESFNKALAMTKYKQMTLLATKLYGKTLPINRERIAKRAESSQQNIAAKKPSNPHRIANYAEKAKENRKKRIEKRKKQKEMLKNGIP